MGRSMKHFFSQVDMSMALFIYWIPYLMTSLTKRSLAESNKCFSEKRNKCFLPLASVLLSFRVEDGNGGLLPETENDERGFNDDEDGLLGDEDGTDLKGDGPGQQGKTGDRAPAAGTEGTLTHQSKTGTAQGAALDEESGMGFVPVSGGQQVSQDGAVELNQRGTVALKSWLPFLKCWRVASPPGPVKEGTRQWTT
jgi:hypothetical protein